MRAHLAGVRSIGAGTPNGSTRTSLRGFRFLAQGEDLFPPDGCTTPHWPPRGRTAGGLRRCAPRVPLEPDRWPRGPHERLLHLAVEACGPARERTGRSAAVRAAALRARRMPSSRGGALAMSPYTHEHSCGRRGSICARRKPGGLSWAGTGRGNRRAPARRSPPRTARVSGAHSERDSSLLSLSSRWVALPAFAETNVGLDGRYNWAACVSLPPRPLVLDLAQPVPRRLSSSSRRGARVRPALPPVLEALELGRFSSSASSASDAKSRPACRLVSPPAARTGRRPPLGLT